MPRGPLPLLALFLRALAGRRPLSGVKAGDLFPRVFRGVDVSPGALFGGRAGPLPTNAWWENLVTAADPEAPEGNVFQMPYVVLAGQGSMHIMQPVRLSSARQTFTKDEAVTLGCVESLWGPIVDSYDDLSVTVGWHSNEGLEMNVLLVRGSPYITTEYAGTTPLFSTKQKLRASNGAPFITVDGKSVLCDGESVIEGVVLGFELAETGSMWLLFAPTETRWACSPAPFSLVARSALYGAVRVALAQGAATAATVGPAEEPPTAAERALATAAYVSLLVRHAGSYPTSASLDFEVEGDVGKVSWRWRTRGLGGWQDGQLLQLAWPVHVPLLPADVRQAMAANPATPFRDVRGPAVAVVGNSWHLSYKLFPDVGFRAPRPVHDRFRKPLLEALRGSTGSLWNGHKPDKDFDLPLQYQLGMGDTYFSGKMLARLARLVVIADELGQSTEDYFHDMVRRLRDRLEVWLEDNATTPFIYDASWGGLVSCGCLFEECNGQCDPHCDNKVWPPESCPALEDLGMNFGNSVYNDHHFHYGYFVYSAAVLAKHMPKWERKWREKILALVRDYGNPSPQDTSFPVARHKDWFLGISWAGGIEAGTKDGRNQESASEAINSYYALYAYGATVDAPFAKELKDFGRLMTAMESHGADIYWHVRSDSQVYGDFPHKVVGILWEHRATFQTWFGEEKYLVSGIQLLPFTPVMEDFLKADWVLEHFDSFKEECYEDSTCEDGWSWTVCMELAVLDADAALACLRALPSLAFSPDNFASCGNSLANSLHWLGTRPSFRLPEPLPTLAPLRRPPDQNKSADASLELALTPMNRCSVGEVVWCPGGTSACAGDQCCPGDWICPSASTNFSMCKRGKLQDCTGFTIPTPPPTAASKSISDLLPVGVLIRRFADAGRRPEGALWPRFGLLAAAVLSAGACAAAALCSVAGGAACRACSRNRAGVLVRRERHCAVPCAELA